MRGARATSINHDGIFAGVGMLFTQDVDTDNQSFLSLLRMNCDTSNGVDKAVSVRIQGNSRLTSIYPSYCHDMSNICISAIAHGCPQLI